jgi:hypothetical protein
MDEDICSFKSNYGIHPEVSLVLYQKLRLVDCQLPIKHLLWALVFLKTYATKDSLAKKFSTMRKTLRKHVWPVVKKIASLADRVVSSSFVVDCCMIQFFLTH